MLTNSAPGAADPTLALQRLRNLPALSASTTKIFSLTIDPESSLTDLEQVFRSDPGLTADLLITANSAAFCGRARISTIKHALTILGLDRVLSLAMAVGMSRYIRAHAPREATERIWGHAVATGVVAERLAKTSDLTSGPVVYTAGLLHDVGRLGLLANYKELYKNFLSMEFLNIEDSDEQEKQTFGITHTVAGELLSEAWALPLSLSDCCRCHHDDTKTDKEEVRIIRTACIIADALGYPEVSLKEGAKSAAADVWIDACSNSLGASIEATIKAFSF